MTTTTDPIRDLRDLAPSDDKEILDTLTDADAVARQLLAHPDPDAAPVKLRAAWRNLNCNMNGPEAYRRVRYPGRTEWEWPDGPRLPGRGDRASERRCSVYCEVPPGTIVATFERDVYKGSKGRCSVRFSFVLPSGILSDGKVLMALEHRTLRSRPVWELTLPDGSTVDYPREH